MSPSTDNPYKAPEADLRHSGLDDRGREPTAREVFLAWERLRLLYNALLVVETLSLAGYVGLLIHTLFWIEATAGALVANFCFSTGPMFEGYLSLMGLDRQVSRGLVFSCGTLLSILLTGAAILASI